MNVSFRRSARRRAAIGATVALGLAVAAGAAPAVGSASRASVAPVSDASATGVPASVKPSELATPVSNLPTGFMDYNLNSTHPKEFQLASAAGAQWVRLDATWPAIAPAVRSADFNATDPDSSGYNWSALDQTIRLAAAAHLQVLLNIDRAPTWAETGHVPKSVVPGTWEPNPQELADFAQAVATRYSGTFPDPKHKGQDLPEVSYFQIWNEPNLQSYLSPQWSRNSKGVYTPASPGLYRQMLDDSYQAIKSVQPNSFVMSGGTAPYGDPPGQLRMAPVTFLRALFCLKGAALTPEKCPPVYLDGLDHHPYGKTPTTHAALPNDVGVPDLGKLEKIVAAAERAGHVLPAGPKPFWVTEIDWQSNPPESQGAAFPVSLATQAQYVSLAFYELWKQGVANVMWYLVEDDSSIPAFSGSGVYYSNGQPKPSETAFKFPFVALSGGGQFVRIWARAPAAGPVTIEENVNGGWTKLGSVTATSAGQIVQAVYPVKPSASFRAVSGSIVSVPYTG